LPAPVFPSSFETMLLIARSAFPGALGFALLLAGVGCSSDSNLRDQNYGSDAGAGYQLPDGGKRDTLVLMDAPVLDQKNDTTPEDRAADAPDAGADVLAEADTSTGGSD
jgi:hypothetical protein